MVGGNGLGKAVRRLWEIQPDDGRQVSDVGLAKREDILLRFGQRVRESRKESAGHFDCRVDGRRLTTRSSGGRIIQQHSRDQPGVLKNGVLTGFGSFKQLVA